MSALADVGGRVGAVSVQCRPLPTSAADVGLVSAQCRTQADVGGRQFCYPSDKCDCGKASMTVDEGK